MTDNNTQEPKESRIRPDSVFYTRILPGVLIGLGVFMTILVILALGVLLGYVPFK